jgi:hypothetical protein
MLSFFVGLKAEETEDCREEGVREEKEMFGKISNKFGN